MNKAMVKANAQPSGNLGLSDDRSCCKQTDYCELDSEQEVPECLTTASVFTKWEEEPLSLQDCTVQVDSKGFFCCYSSDLEKETVCIDLSQVSDVRTCIPKEKVRDMWESVSQEPLNERSFAIVFGSNMVEVNFLRLVSPCTKLAKAWIHALNVLIRKKKFQNPSVTLLLEKQYVRSRCLRNSNGKIPIRNICKCLTTARYEQRFYDGMQTLQLPHEKNDEIDPDEFTLNHFYKLYTFLCPRQDLDELFMKKCGGRAPFMKLQQVVDFINGEQRDPRLNEILFPFCSTEKASKLIQTYELSPELSQTNRMSFDGLARFLMSEDNLILKRDHLSIKHDLNHPLTHYFIHSSHNTYLIGRQFGGKSSVEMYRQCLLAGCRCIELDCWDGLGDEPIITHGKALCSNILFKDVILAIKESAFVASPLPVILSFENHCSRLQQRKLAEYCIEIFDDMLLHLPLDSNSLEEGVPLPSPNQLLNKILIKNKKLNPDVENDLLMSESFDNLSEKQCQAMIENCSDQNDDSDNQPSSETSSTHLAVRPCLTPKRLSVITEGAAAVDANDKVKSHNGSVKEGPTIVLNLKDIEATVESLSERSTNHDTLGGSSTNKDTLQERSTTVDIPEERTTTGDTFEDGTTTSEILEQNSINVDPLKDRKTAADTPGEREATVDTPEERKTSVGNLEQKIHKDSAATTNTHKQHNTNIDTFVDGTATMDALNNIIWSSQKEDFDIKQNSSFLEKNDDAEMNAVDVFVESTKEQSVVNDYKDSSLLDSKGDDKFTNENANFLKGFDVSEHIDSKKSVAVDKEDSQRNRNKTDGDRVLDSKTIIVSNGKSTASYDFSVSKIDILSQVREDYPSMSLSPDIDDDIVSSPERSRTESVQSDVSEVSMDEGIRPLNTAVYSENSTKKNRKTPSPLLFNGSYAKKITDSFRRVKSPVGKQYSLNEKPFKYPLQGKSLSADYQESKRQRMLGNGSLDEFNDSDEDTRRINHPRSASSTSTGTVGGTLKLHKKSCRGASFTSEDDEMASQQLYAHKNIDPLLSSLVNYVQPSVFQSFEHAEEQNVSYKMSSFNESSAIHLVKTGPVEFTKYNKRQFSRIYPKGTRVDSTNYNPQAFWNVGCQMVTLNLQTPDVPFQLNHAKFEANSQLGYLLKPEIMRRCAEKAFDPFTESPLDGIIPATVVVKVISGQFLTDKKSQTYVMVELYGLPADTKRKNKTKLASNNFMNTLFSDECFVFTKVILPELALMRFAVYDESDRVLGQVVLPLEVIQPGYRHIPLRTESGSQCQLSTLFVHISLKTYVPEKFADFADRLFDPMKYETQIEKRSKQMRKFDITEMEEDSDIPIQSNISNSSHHSVTSLYSISSSMQGSVSGSPFTGRKFVQGDSGLDSIMKVEEEPVKFEDFKHDKQYLKLLKKHQKDLDMLEKKQEKERSSMQKMKQTQREKIKASFEKNKMSEEKILEKVSKRSGTEICNELLMKFEQKMKFLEEHMHEKLVECGSKMNQEEAEMTAKHIHERVGLRLYQVAEQLEYLKSLLYQSQHHEEKLLREQFDREMTELKKKQAKLSIDGAKTLSADKSIKTKEEKERLQRERDRQNMGLFISGRQELMREQEKEMEDLRRKHREDIERMEKEQNKIMEGEKSIFRKVTVAKQQILQS